MRDAFNKGVSDPRVTCSEGTFEKTGVEDGWADLVVVAQVRHFYSYLTSFQRADRIEEGMALVSRPRSRNGTSSPPPIPSLPNPLTQTEIARVLKPTGIASFIWNLEDRTSAPWLAACRDVYEAYESGTPQFRLGLWRNTFTQPSYLALYRPQEEYEFTQILPTTAEGVENRFLSKSYIAVLGEEEKSKVKGKVRGILEGERNDLRWIDREKGVFEFPYRTTLIVMRRK
jgi:hypothetical protein